MGRWRPCTSSTRSASLMSATAPPSISAAIAKRLDSLEGLRILDIGCGGGILCEPLARLGASVVGADPSASNIAVARRHAAQSGLTVDYREATAEGLADAGETVRRRSRHGSGRARRRRRSVRRSRRGDGETRRAVVRRHAQPHRQKLCAGDRRRRIHFALVAARHPSMGQVRDARTSSRSRSSKRACASPARPA